MLDGSPCLTAAAAPGQSRRVSSQGVARADSNTHTAWEWAGQETQALRAMLRALHGYCAQQKSRGWTALEQTACHLRYLHKMVLLGCVIEPPQTTQMCCQNVALRKLSQRMHAV